MPDDGMPIETGNAVPALQELAVRAAEIQAQLNEMHRALLRHAQQPGTTEKLSGVTFAIGQFARSKLPSIVQLLEAMAENPALAHNDQQSPDARVHGGGHSAAPALLRRQEQVNDTSKAQITYPVLSEGGNCARYVVRTFNSIAPLLRELQHGKHYLKTHENNKTIYIFPLDENSKSPIVEGNKGAFLATATRIDDKGNPGEDSVHQLSAEEMANASETAKKSQNIGRH